MIRLIVVMGFLAAAVDGAAQERFSERLTAEERQRAGLDRLAPEALAALDELVARDRRQGEARLRETARAEVMREQEEKKSAEVRVLARIAGKFSGWEGNTVFKLVNGQVWRQVGTEIYYVSPVDSPAVLIEKVHGGWRLYDQAGGWVKVARVK